MIPIVKASLELEQFVIPAITVAGSLLVGIVSFFITRFFAKTEKHEESTVQQVTHIALIHEKLGNLTSSDLKQWGTVDTLVREVADLKLKIAVIEDRGKK